VISARFRVVALLMMAFPLAARARGGELPSPRNADGRAPAAAQAALVEVAKLRLPRVSRPPQLKEFLNGTPREAEAVVTGFRQREPGDGMPVSQSTAAYLSYDDRNLYVVFVCEDDGGARGHMAKREELNDDDLVGVYLDTFNDRRHAYGFEANPLGLQRDALFNEGQKTDYTFDAVWTTDGRLTANGYVVSMAIPFKSLRFTNGDVQTWGIALRRKILRSNEEAYWPFITQRVSGFINQMAALEGMNRVSGGRNVQVTPYGTFTGSRQLDGSTASFFTQTDRSGGVDSKVVIKDALTLDVTANPDFSQVESDEPQVTVNQRYEVKFPEKRPFFMENAGYFQTPVNLFYSRRIIEPQVGARLTGKVNQWAVGALVMDDRAPGALFATGDPRHGDRAGAGVFRLQREFGSQSSAGVLVTSRDFGSSSNHVVGFDTRLKLSRNWYFTGQMMDSETELGGKRSSGQAYLARFDYSGRHFFHSTSYTDLGPSFRTDMGYVRRVNLRGVSEYAGYLWYPKSRGLLSFGPSLSVSGDWDHQNQLQDWNAYPTFVLNFPRQTQIKVAQSRSYELFDAIGFRTNISELTVYSSLAKSFGVSSSFTTGQAVNYAPASGIAPFLGQSRSASIGWTWRPDTRLRIDNYYYYTRLAEGAVGAPAAAGVGRQTVFDNHLARLKLNYQFTRALSVRSIVDYYALLPNERLIEYTRSKVVTGDLLLTYLIHPGTALYIGYTNRMENVAIDPGTPSALRLTSSPGTATNRQLFTKISYLLRF
jgi:hypothetical protein